MHISFRTDAICFRSRFKNITVVTVAGDLMNSSLVGGGKPYSSNFTQAFAPSPSSMVVQGKLFLHQEGSQGWQLGWEVSGESAQGWNGHKPRAREGWEGAGKRMDKRQVCKTIKSIFCTGQ